MGTISNQDFRGDQVGHEQKVVGTTGLESQGRFQNPKHGSYTKNVLMVPTYVVYNDFSNSKI